MAKAHPPQTLDHFIKSLERQNKTAATWAREKGLDVYITYQVMAGRVIGRRGKGREIVIAMGLTPPPMLGRSKSPSNTASAA